MCAFHTAGRTGTIQSRRNPAVYGGLTRCLWLGREQPLYSVNECRRRLSSKQSRPLNMTKGVRNIRSPFWRGVNNDRDKERNPLGQVVRAIDGEFPLAP